MQVLLDSMPVQQTSLPKPIKPVRESEETSFEQMLSETPPEKTETKPKEHQDQSKKTETVSNEKQNEAAPGKPLDPEAQQTTQLRDVKGLAKPQDYKQVIASDADNESANLLHSAAILSTQDNATVQASGDALFTGELDTGELDTGLNEYSRQLAISTSDINDQELLAASLNISAATELKDFLPIQPEASNIDQKISDTPILALLSGKVADIPKNKLLDLIVENQFLNQALSSSELTSFLETPKPILTWLEDMGLSPDMIEQVPELKNLASTPIDALTLLDALAIDPENAQAELNNLSNKIAYAGVDGFVETYGKDENQLPVLQDQVKPSPEFKAKLVDKDPFESITNSWKSDETTFIDLEAPSAKKASVVANEINNEATVDEQLPEKFKADIESLDNQEKLDLSMATSSDEQSMNSDEQDPSSEKFADSKDNIDFSNFELGVQRGAAKEFKSMVSSTEQQHDLSRVQTELVQKAEMLIKDGGGSIKLDFNVESLGKLDVALSIEDKQLKLRITASNDHIREALAAELPRLKEALQAQQLDLKNIEVGIKQESNWQQDDRNRQGQTWQEESISSGDGWQRQSKQVKFQEQSWIPATRNYNGRINVRV